MLTKDSKDIERINMSEIGPVIQHGRNSKLNEQEADYIEKVDKMENIVNRLNYIEATVYKVFLLTGIVSTMFKQL